MVAFNEDDITEAVIRYELERFERLGQKYDFIFIETANKLDPSPEVLARFTANQPPVLPVSLSEKGMLGVRHWYGHKGRGLILRVTEINLLGPNTVEVEGGHVSGGRGSSGRTYSVERRGGRWIVTGDKMWFGS